MKTAFLTLLLSLALLSTCILASNFERDEYVVKQGDTFQWIDLTGESVTDHSIGVTGYLGNITIGFPFRFNGEDFNSFGFTTLGYLTFQIGSGATSYVPQISDSTCPVGDLYDYLFATSDQTSTWNLIVLLQGDNVKATDSAAGISVKSESFGEGSCPYKQQEEHACFVLSYAGVTDADSTNMFADVQVILVDNGNIIVQYRTVGSVPWPGRTSGIVATKNDGTDPINYPDNCNSAYANGTYWWTDNAAVMYLPPVKCADDQIYNGLDCVFCPSGETPTINATTCVECPANATAGPTTGCVACLDNTVPNEDRSQCVACAGRQIPNDDHTICEDCPAGSIPRNDNTGCIACGDAQEVDDTGVNCVKKTIDDSGSASQLSLFGLW